MSKVDLVVGHTVKIVDTDEVKTNHWRNKIAIVLHKEPGNNYQVMLESGPQHRAILPRKNLVRVERRWVEVIEEVDDDESYPVRTV